MLLPVIPPYRPAALKRVSFGDGWRFPVLSVRGSRAVPSQSSPKGICG